MPIDNTIATQVQTPNLMNTLGNVMNVANSATALKQNQMDLQERNSLRELSKNLDKFKTPDGNLDINNLANEATKVSPKLGAQWATQIAQAHAEGVVVDKALNELSEQQRGIIGQMVLSTAGQPFEQQANVINSVVNANPRLKIWGDVALKHLQSVSDNPEAAKNMAMQIAKGTVGVQAQNQLNTPQLVQSADQGGNPVYRNINPMAQGAAPSIASGPALGVTQNVADLQKEVQATRQAGDQVPVQRNINQNILRLSRDTKTGPGSGVWQKTMGAVLAPLGLSGGTDNYQELGKFLEKNAIQNMQAMGGSPSDARLSAAAAANGTTEFNPGALQMVTKLNDATLSGVDKYRQGMDKAVGVENPNFANAAKFKSEWAKNLDIDVFRVENAIRDHDTMELQKIKQELGPERMKELARKRKNLESLSSTGHL